jgi:hypothetical protein
LLLERPRPGQRLNRRGKRPHRIDCLVGDDVGDLAALRRPALGGPGFLPAADSLAEFVPAARPGDAQRAGRVNDVGLFGIATGPFADAAIRHAVHEGEDDLWRAPGLSHGRLLLAGAARSAAR